MLVYLATILSSSVSFVSLPQMTAFLIATIALLMFSGPNGSDFYLKNLCIRGSQGIFKGRSWSASSGDALRPISTVMSVIVVLVCILASACLLWFGVIAAISTIPSSFPAHLDQTFSPKSRFDIVVSMYDEDPASVRQMLSSIKSTSLLRIIQPRVIIYSKNAATEPETLKIATGADIVEQLENLGREGGTYLDHIVNKWDELAHQTMFIQAHAHNMRELIPRIDNFLVTNTGMLSLGFTGVICDCETCNDRWGWEDMWDVIPTLYKKVNNNTCEGPMLLSYKGQFVASGRRIRGISLGIYQDLLDAVTSKSGWSHDPSVVSDAIDRPDAPYFGYTVERIWNLLMQCSNLEIATLCPSLLSGWRRGGRQEDCQCLD
jgi:hypothetical protein